MRRLLAAAATLSLVALFPACAKANCGAMVDALVACQFSGFTSANRAILETSCDNSSDSTRSIECLTAAYKNNCTSDQSLNTAVEACR